MNAKVQKRLVFQSGYFTMTSNNDILPVSTAKGDDYTNGCLN